MARPTPRIMYDCQGAECPECERYTVCKSLDWNESQVFTAEEKVSALISALEEFGYDFEGKAHEICGVVYGAVDADKPISDTVDLILAVLLPPALEELGVKYVPEKVAVWRRMGSYCRATQDSPIAISKAVTGFQCTGCGNKWFTQEFSVEGKEQTPDYCERCGAKMKPAPKE